MKAGFSKKQDGQVSVELALVVGAIFLIVITIIPYITDANTMNKGVSAARDGGTFAQTMLNMGYSIPTSSGNVSLQRGQKVRLDGLSYDRSTAGDTKIVTITLTLSGISDTAVADEIVNQAGNSVYYAYNGAWNASTNGIVTVGNYQFKVIYQFA